MTASRWYLIACKVSWIDFGWYGADRLWWCGADRLWGGSTGYITIETQMIQNSIFTSKRIDEQNGSLHQHKSTFVVIDYYQGFKPPFLRLILREFKGKNRGRFGWTTLVRSSKWRQRHSPEADFNKIYDKPAYNTKKCCYRHTIYTIKRTHLLQITK